MRGNLAQEPGVVGDRIAVVLRPERPAVSRERIRQSIETPTALDLGVRLREFTAGDPLPVLR